MSNTPYQPWMRSLLNRMKELYGKENATTISEALPDGNFFEIKGSVASSSDLPDSGNNVGDIYIVTEDGSEYIWVTSETYPNGYWEQLGTGGGSVTVDDIISATTGIDALKQRSIRNNIDVDRAKSVVEVSDTDASFIPVADVYKCGTLTSLTLVTPPAIGHYSVRFTSGATPTTTTIPSTIKGLETFAAEANTRYEIDVEDNYAVVAKWAVGA